MKKFPITLTFFLLAVVIVPAIAAQTPLLISGDRAGAVGDGASTLNDFSTSFKTRKISNDGRFVVFSSRAADLTATADTNGVEDVFVRDLTTGTTELISVNNSGIESGNGASTGATISSDGRFVAFVSQATNLVATNDTNGAVYDVFIRELATKTTRLVSVNVSGAATGHGASLFPVINADGRYVAFESFADDLSATPDNFGSNDIFVRDVIGGVTEQVSVTAKGASADANSTQPAISADGRTIAFQSNASLTRGIDNGTQDVYVRTLANETTTLVSASIDSEPTNGSGSGSPSISADGRFVAFSSSATNLVNLPTGGLENVFVRDLQSRSTVLASVNSAGTSGGKNSSNSPVISADGSVVVFQSAASNLTTVADLNGLSDVFARDLQAGKTTLVSVNRSGAGSGDAFSGEPNVSADGDVVTFISLATNLTNIADSNDEFDVFVRNLPTQTTRLASVNRTGTASGNAASGNFRPIYPAISGNGQTVAFESLASDIANLDSNETYDVFAVLLSKPTVRKSRIRVNF